MEAPHREAKQEIEDITSDLIDKAEAVIEEGQKFSKMLLIKSGVMGSMLPNEPNI